MQIDVFDDVLAVENARQAELSRYANPVLTRMSATVSASCTSWEEDAETPNPAE
jgi:hypothetical protein